MTEEQFWYGDIRLFAAYQKAYLRDVSYRAWRNGEYNAIAFEVGYGNCWAKNKDDKAQFIDWIDPIKTIEEKSLTRSEREYKGKQENLNQARWFSDLLHSK